MKSRLLKVSFLLVAILSTANAWTATVVVGDGAVRPGGTVDIAVSVDAGVDLGGVNLRIEYDPATFVSGDVSPGPLLDSSHVVKSHSPAAGKFNVAAYAPVGAPSFTGQTGTAFTISLQVSPSAATGEYPISFSAAGTPLLGPSGLSDMSGTSIAHAADPGSVTVFEALVADINADGNVTGADLIIILRDWHESSADPSPEGDITGDDTVNEDDVMTFLNDWEVPPPGP
jgi:hypothetical protein